VPTPVVSAAAPAVAPAPAPVSSPVIPPGSDPSLLVAVDDSVRPVSSTIAHTLTASANAAAAAEKAARVTKVQRAYITMPVKHMGKVATMPLSTSLPQADAFSQLIRSVRIVLNDILVYCDDSGTTIDSDTYVRGWERPLEKRLLDAVSAGKSATSDLSLTIAGPTLLSFCCAALRNSLIKEIVRSRFCACRTSVFLMALLSRITFGRSVFWSPL